MTDVKSVIALLCKHLKLSFNVNIRPEHFRLAKFDKTEDNVVSTLSVRLNHILVVSSSKLIHNIIQLRLCRVHHY